MRAAILSLNDRVAAHGAAVFDSGASINLELTAIILALEDSPARTIRQWIPGYETSVTAPCWQTLVTQSLCELDHATSEHAAKGLASLALSGHSTTAFVCSDPDKQTKGQRGNDSLYSGASHRSRLLMSWREGEQRWTQQALLMWIQRENISTAVKRWC